jgi:hypothetical protein
LPGDLTDTDLVYDANANSKGARLNDARVNGSGNPCCLIVESDGVGGDGTIRYIEWNGSSWITPENIAGNPVLSTNYKFAGACFDPIDTDFVYLVNEDATYFYLERWERVGANDWDKVETVRQTYKNGKGLLNHPRPVKRSSSALLKCLTVETADHTGEVTQKQWGFSGLIATPFTSNFFNGRLASGGLIQKSVQGMIGTAYTSDMNVSTFTLSVSAMKRSTVSATEDICCRRDNTNPTHPGFILLLDSTGKLRIAGFTTNTSNSVDLTTTAEYDDNVARKVDAVFDTTVAGSGIWVNGTEVAVTNASAGTYTGVTNNTTTPWSIGSRWSSFATPYQGSARFVLFRSGIPSANLLATEAAMETQSSFYTVGTVEIKP